MNASVNDVGQEQWERYYFLFDCPEAASSGLKVLDFTIEENVSRPFKITLSLATQKKGLTPADLKDRFARLILFEKHSGAVKRRYFCGIVTQAERRDMGFDTGFTRFAVIIRPDLYRAKYIWNNRIFQNRTVKSIVAEVLKESGVRKIEWELKERHAPREYVVQYKRSNLQFIERLLASEGIAYRFDHQEDGVRLVMFDTSGAVTSCPGAETLEYNATAGSDLRAQGIRNFSWTESICSSQATYREQHFKNPAFPYEYSWSGENGVTQAMILEKYSFPGYYKSDEIGEQMVRYEAEALQAEARIGEGAGQAQFLAPGTRFTMTDHDEADYNTSYFLVAVRHEGRQKGAEEAFASQHDGTFLTTRFRCIRDTTPWRPLRPEVQQTDGDHIATVVGPANEEIYCDEFGRVKIFFHWDRAGRQDETASCWVRVSQGWAGQQYGGMAIPRIGQSVVVSYINGDVEQPLITGRVFNSVEQVPYPLPTHKTKMVIRSHTHKGEGDNELSFEDEKGQEKIYIHGQKDQEIHIENDRVKRVDRNQHDSVGHNRSIEVGNNHTEMIGGDMTLMVGPSILQKAVTEKLSKFSAKIGDITKRLLGPTTLPVMGSGNLNIAVGRNKLETVTASSSELIGVAKTLTTGGGYQLTVGGIKNESVGVGSWENVGQTKTTIVGHRYEIVVGKSRILLEADGTVTIECDTLNLTGHEAVNIKSKTVNIDGSDAVIVKSKAIHLN